MSNDSRNSRGPSKALRVANLAMTIYFAICVALQYNDPDPYLWMPMYGAAMVACILFSRSTLRPWIAGLIGGLALAWAGTIAPRVVGQDGFAHMFESMKASNPLIEESREMGGLLIVFAWMAALTVASAARASAARATGSGAAGS